MSDETQCECGDCAECDKTLDGRVAACADCCFERRCPSHDQQDYWRSMRPGVERRETLEQIAKLIHKVSPSAGAFSGRVHLTLSCDEPSMVDAIFELGAKKSAFVSNRGSVLISAQVTIGGVVFSAQYDRPATEEEKSALSSDRARFHGEALVTADVQP